MIVMNKTAYERLSAEVRAAIDRTTGFEFSLAMGASRDKWEANALETLKARGQHTVRSFTPEQRKEIAARVAPVAEEWAASMARQGYDGNKILSRARELIRERSGKPT
jgi:TRAP-type C4-dicarboxylate transport system substrate-binding protein